MRRNRFIQVILASAVLLASPAVMPAHAQTSASLTLGAASLYPGNSVTLTGTSPYAEVIVKVMAPDNTNVFYTVAPVTEGKYSVSFTLSDNAATGTYRVIAGKGTDVQGATFSVTGSSSSGTTTSGGAAGPGASPAAKPQAEARVEFKASDIPAPSNGYVTLPVKWEQDTNKINIILPASLGQILGNNSLQLALPTATITIPKEIVEALQQLAGSASQDSVISLSINRLVKDETESLLNRISSEKSASVRPASEVLDFVLTVQTKGANGNAMKQFNKPVMLKFKLSGAVDQKLTGIYYIADDGSLEYVGGSIKSDSIEAGVNHFSKYAALTYSKSYSDVPASHWASDVIQILSARQVVDGISSDTFVPEKKVNRAEFVTMLTRYLKLTASKPASFTDVPANSWYASHVAAAFEKGIIEGTSETTFSPEQEITREEMAVMLSRVYAQLTGSKTPAPAASFADGKDISSWAKASIDAAVQAELMNGRAEGIFAPKERATRAESSQVLYNLMMKK